jgi:hypothetical protein
MFWRRRNDQDVEAGAVYARKERGKVVETARVLSIASDRAGIPHVRYLLRKEREWEGGREEPRTLAMDSFRDLFPDRAEF